MNIFDFFNQRVKRFSVWDVKLLQFFAIFLILVIVKLVPSILKINIWWFVLLGILSVLRPAYLIFIKK